MNKAIFILSATLLFFCCNQNMRSNSSNLQLSKMENRDAATNYREWCASCHGTQLQDFVNLYERDPVFERLGRKFAEWLLIRKELRARSLLQQQAKQRYIAFAQNYPEFVLRVPQYHIASYLGITEVSLSRIKRSLKSESEANDNMP